MQNFDDKLAQWVVEAGGVSAACLPLNEDLLAELRAHAQRKKLWLDEGKGGEMAYLERQLEQKADPVNTFDGARSVIVITFSNDWGKPTAKHPFPEPTGDAPLGWISAYAKEQDYHTTGHRILENLAAKIAEQVGEFPFTACVDSRPVFERLFALKGGLGIQAPNDLIRTPELESRAFLGTLFCPIDLPEVIRDPKPRFPCGFCRNCETNCPTGAITPGETFDARLCISYLTIEKKGALDSSERKLMDKWLFGCDLCTEVCPPKDKMPQRIAIDLEWLLKTGTGELRRMIKGSALDYAGVQKLRRNAIAILRESAHPRAEELLDWSAKNLNSPHIKAQLEIE